MIGDRKFASIIQKFLHEYGEIKINCIQIVAPYEEDPSGAQPRVRAKQNNRPLRFEMAEAQMPTNIKNFTKFKMRFAFNFLLSNRVRPSLGLNTSLLLNQSDRPESGHTPEL
jgi:hypothetical protein